MDLHAYTKTVYDLFSINKKYIVPRFQREYSWGEEEVSELWKDLIASISIKEDKLKNKDYFIGSLVLIGEDNSIEFKIVDGQQRLTTIMMLLSALVDTFKDINQIDLAQGLYSFIEGRDVSNRQFFKLENENPKPFLQNSIQNITKTKANPSSSEETNLYNAFSIFLKRLQKNVLLKEFEEFCQTSKATEAITYCTILEAIRDQALTFLKIIYITVSTEDEAYTIFETLNARGMNLTPVDLIKNEIFKVMANEHPTDEAKHKWKKLYSTLASREDTIDINIYMRHFWLSTYEFTTEDKIYKSFKDKTNGDKNIINTLLDNILLGAQSYKKITTPHSTDWLQQEEKSIYNSLVALNIFKVTQVRTFLLALFAQREKKLLKLGNLKECMSNIEDFHFLFSAITSSRASGLESKYSKCARNLRDCKDNASSIKVLEELKDYLKIKTPSSEVVKEGFKKLTFTNDETRHKKLIQYVFRRLELSYAKTNELEPDQVSLEHIVSQSENEGQQVLIGSIGNLLPLGGDINSIAGSNNFTTKLDSYKTSSLLVVKEFVAKHKDKKEWTENDINNRTMELADLTFKICKN